MYPKLSKKSMIYQYRADFAEIDSKGNHTYRSIYILHGESPDQALKDFKPDKIIDDDWDNPVPLESPVLLSLSEELIYSTFQLQGEMQYQVVKEKAQKAGLDARKGVGAYVLRVEGRGDWMITQEWVKGLKKINSNWAYF